MDTFRCQVEEVLHSVCRVLSQLCCWPQIPKSWHTGVILPWAQSRACQTGCLVCNFWGHGMERRAQLLTIYAWVLLRESHCHKALCFRPFFSMRIGKQWDREVAWRGCAISIGDFWDPDGSSPEQLDLMSQLILLWVGGCALGLLRSLPDWLVL